MPYFSLLMKTSNVLHFGLVSLWSYYVKLTIVPCWRINCTLTHFQLDTHIAYHNCYLWLVQTVCLFFCLMMRTMVKTFTCIHVAFTFVEPRNHILCFIITFILLSSLSILSSRFSGFSYAHQSCRILWVSLCPPALQDFLGFAMPTYAARFSGFFYAHLPCEILWVFLCPPALQGCIWRQEVSLLGSLNMYPRINNFYAKYLCQLGGGGCRHAFLKSYIEA